MGIKFSTGLCDRLLGGISGNGTLKEQVDGLWKLMIYDGTPPATADSALSGNTLLCTVANGGAEVNLDTAAAAGTIAKASGETWNGVNAATGTATFYRFQTTADAGALSTVLPRIQGTVGTGGADFNVGSTSLVATATFTAAVFTITFLPS